MDDVLARMWTDLRARLTGPLTLRLYLQPAMATLYAAAKVSEYVGRTRMPAVAVRTGAKQAPA